MEIWESKLAWTGLKQKNIHCISRVNEPIPCWPALNMAARSLSKWCDNLYHVCVTFAFFSLTRIGATSVPDTEIATFIARICNTVGPQSLAQEACATFYVPPSPSLIMTPYQLSNCFSLKNLSSSITWPLSKWHCELAPGVFPHSRGNK